MRLRRLLRERQKQAETDLWRALMKMWDIAAETWLPRMGDRSDSYNGRPHVIGVERHLDRLVPDEVKQDLSSTEIFVLLAAVLLHDIGKLDLEQPLDAADEKEGRVPSGQAEDRHWKDSCLRIQRDWALLGIPEPELASWVALLACSHGWRSPREPACATGGRPSECRFHCPACRTGPTELDVARTVYGEKPRLAWLASLLRIADEADNCKSRAVPAFVRTRAGRSNTARAETWREHVSAVEFDAVGRCVRLLTERIEFPAMQELRNCARGTEAPDEVHDRNLHACIERYARGACQGYGVFPASLKSDDPYTILRGAHEEAGACLDAMGDRDSAYEKMLTGFREKLSEEASVLKRRAPLSKQESREVCKTAALLKLIATWARRSVELHDQAGGGTGGPEKCVRAISAAQRLVCEFLDLRGNSAWRPGELQRVVCALNDLRDVLKNWAEPLREVGLYFEDAFLDVSLPHATLLSAGAISEYLEKSGDNVLAGPVDSREIARSIEPGLVPGGSTEFLERVIEAMGTLGRSVAMPKHTDMGVGGFTWESLAEEAGSSNSLVIQSAVQRIRAMREDMDGASNPRYWRRGQQECKELVARIKGFRRVQTTSRGWLVEPAPLAPPLEPVPKPPLKGEAVDSATRKKREKAIEQLLALESQRFAVESQRGTDLPPAIPTGLPALDALFRPDEVVTEEEQASDKGNVRKGEEAGGFHVPRGFYVPRQGERRLTPVVAIHGGSGQGKTTLCLQIACNLANLGGGWTCVFYSLEESVESTVAHLERHWYFVPSLAEGLIEQCSLPTKPEEQIRRGFVGGLKAQRRDRVITGDVWFEGAEYKNRLLLPRLSPRPVLAAGGEREDLFERRYAELEAVLRIVRQNRQNRRCFFFLDSLTAFSHRALTRSQIHRLFSLFRTAEVPLLVTLERQRHWVGEDQEEHFNIARYLADIVIGLEGDDSPGYYRQTIEVTKSRFCRRILGKHLMKLKAPTQMATRDFDPRNGVVIYPSVHLHIVYCRGGGDRARDTSGGKPLAPRSRSFRAIEIRNADLPIGSLPRALNYWNRLLARGKAEGKVSGGNQSVGEDIGDLCKLLSEEESEWKTRVAPLLRPKTHSFRPEVEKRVCNAVAGAELAAFNAANAYADLLQKRGEEDHVKSSALARILDDAVGKCKHAVEAIKELGREDPPTGPTTEGTETSERQWIPVQEIEADSCIVISGPQGGHKFAIAVNLLLGTRPPETESRQSFPRGLIVSLAEERDVKLSNVALVESLVEWRQHLQQSAETREWEGRKLSEHDFHWFEDTAHEFPSVLTLLDFRMGKMMPEEFLYILERYLDREQQRGRPIESVLFTDTAQLRTRFPLLSGEELFLPSLVDILKSRGIFSVFIDVQKEGHPEESLMAAADVRIYIDQNDVRTQNFVRLDNVRGKDYDRERRKVKTDLGSERGPAGHGASEAYTIRFERDPIPPRGKQPNKPEGRPSSEQPDGRPRSPEGHDGS